VYSGESFGTALMGRWRELIAKDTEGAQRALRTLIPADSPTVVEPEAPGGLRLRGEIRLGALFDSPAASLALAAQQWRRHGDSNPGYCSEMLSTLQLPQRRVDLLQHPRPGAQLFFR
jgi:hypothetical protein